MLLFSDGFEYFHPRSLHLKWDETYGYCSSSSSAEEGWRVDNFDGKIVFGEDRTVNPVKPFARKGGRALRLSKPIDPGTYGSNKLRMNKRIRKSRTVFVGLAFRLHPGANDKKIIFHFHTHDGRICNATHHIREDVIEGEWNFDTMGSADKVFTQVFCPGSPYSGDFLYLEVGFTIMGNDPGGAQAWVETRQGMSRGQRRENIYTVNPDSTYDNYKHFINEIAVEVDGEGDISLDDLYICNDEGSFNNSFLGDVRIRARLPEADGTINEGYAVNAGPGGIFDAVRTQMVRTDGEPLPSPEPTPDEDPLYIPWKDPTTSYVQVKRQEDEQLFRFSHPNFADSEPPIFGAIVHVLCSAPDNPTPTAILTPLLKPFGGISFEYGRDWPGPVTDDKNVLQMVHENQEEVMYEWGEIPKTWNATTLNNSEFGFRLNRFIETYEKVKLRNPTFLRHNINFEEKVSDSVLMQDFCHRFWDKVIDEYWSFQDTSSKEYTWALYDNLQVNEEFAQGAKGCIKWVNSVLDLNVNIPWFIFWLHEEMGISDSINLDWVQILEDGLSAGDNAYGFWVEEFSESLELKEISSAPMIFKALDGLGVKEGQVQTNHELIDDSLDVAESYVWSGHEWLGETMYPEDLSRVGILAEALESLGLEEDHFDGNWVQLDSHQISLNDEILTQHWRYEFFMGVIIDSWKIEPIEQPGDRTGDHTGMLTSQYWEMLNYNSDPFKE